MRRLAQNPRRRRTTAGLVTAGLALSGTAALSALGSPAEAAVLGVVSVSPTSGTDATLFGGSLSNAACPAGTADSYWSVDGPGLPADQAILGPGNATGTGAQSFSGASVANVKGANSGSFLASGTYAIKFNCVAASNGAVSATYQRPLNYTAGGAGAWNVAIPTTTALATSPAGPTYVGQQVTLTATLSSAAAEGMVQFKDNGVNLGSPVAPVNGSAQYQSSALPDGQHSFTAAFVPTDANAWAASVSAAKAYPVYGAPSWRPVLYPAPKVGAASLCLASFANVPTTTAYAWYLNGVAISGATASSYTVPEAAYTKKLACKATATNPAGSVNATSAEAVVAVGRALTATTKPYVYGTVKVGYTVTAKVGAWSPAATSYTYAWYVGSSLVSTASSYKVPAAYKGKALSLNVTAKRTGWTNGSYRTAGKVIA